MPANLEVILEEKLVAVKDEFHMLLDKWCQTKLGLSVKDAESVVISNPMAMFADFHGFYLIHRKEARKCVSLCCIMLLCGKCVHGFFPQLENGVWCLFQACPWEHNRKLAEYFLATKIIPESRHTKKQD